MAGCERQQIAAFVSQQVNPVGRDDQIAFGRAVLGKHFIDEFSLRGLHCYSVAGAQAAYVREGCAVGGAVAGDGSVAGLSGHRRPRVMPGAFSQGVHICAFHYYLVHFDGRDDDACHSFSVAGIEERQNFFRTGRIDEVGVFYVFTGQTGAGADYEGLASCLGRRCICRRCAWL